MSGLIAGFLHMIGVRPAWSHGIHERLTAGYGELDDYGFWQYPLIIVPEIPNKSISIGGIFIDVLGVTLLIASWIGVAFSAFYYTLSYNFDWVWGIGFFMLPTAAAIFVFWVDEYIAPKTEVS